ncbi:MAG: protein translocase subunit SecF, partial [Ruminiclostridium sp.]|nr:protein translocase subunit SecF [Ruminiclostridium sp.]
SLSSSTNTVTVSFASNSGLTADVLKEISDKLEAQFKDNELVGLNSQDVKPASGLKFFIKCLVAVLFSFVLLVVYIAFRFKKIGGLSAGVFALIALIHDIIIVFASFIFFRLPIDANFMAVILTILGYSINNTIVTYDRIRENRTLYGKKMGLVELMNTSVTQTMTRSINTTITTAFAALAICIVAWICGVNSIISFAFPLLIGLVAGFYSSVFMSGSMWVMWRLYRDKPAAVKK